MTMCEMILILKYQRWGFLPFKNSILENLKIVVAGSQDLDTGGFKELVNVDKATFEMPQVKRRKVTFELTLTEDVRGEWCVVQGRIRSPSGKWTNYEEFLKIYRHIVEKCTKELYKIYQIGGDDYVNGRRIIPPEKIGFTQDPRDFTDMAVRNIVYENVEAFVILPGEAHTDSIPIVMNPVLQPVLAESQRFLLDDAGATERLREWVALYIRKKDQFFDYNFATIYANGYAAHNRGWFGIRLKCDTEC